MRYSLLPIRSSKIVASTILLSACLLGSGFIHARPLDGLTAENKMEIKIERMTKMLGLTPTQQAEIRKVYTDAQIEREEHQQMMRKQIDSRINAILTDEQKAKKSALAVQNINRRLNQMTKRLRLTETQVSQVRVILEAKQANPQLTRDVHARICAVLTAQQCAIFERQANRQLPQDSQQSLPNSN